jgi:NADH dehydrogenase
MTKRVIVLGGGFAGLSAARELGKTQHVETLLLDRRRASHFLPLLPDLVGRDIPAETLQYPLDHAAKRFGVTYRRCSVLSVDPDAHQVDTSTGKMEFDALILAAGTQTAFYGRDDLQSASMALDSVDDAIALRSAALAGPAETFVIAGGGYTGVEVATNLWRLGRTSHRPWKIVIADSAERLCAGVASPSRRKWLMSAPTFQDYIESNVQGLGIVLRCGTTVTNADSQTVTLSSGECFTNARLVWTAGVHAADILGTFGAAQTRQSRLVVDAHLRVRGAIFAAGDAAGFTSPGSDLPLRLGIQFSLDQGRCAARNALALLEDRPLRVFKPLDLGYVIPLANFRACGKVMGIAISGRSPAMLHYLMSTFRTWSLASRLRLLNALLRSS